MVEYQYNLTSQCPYNNPDARRLWGKACNFHRRSDTNHTCGNPEACERTLAKAWSVELNDKGMA
jgi:hypothetical protein